jgi:hypothetical protein
MVQRLPSEHDESAIRSAFWHVPERDSSLREVANTMRLTDGASRPGDCFDYGLRKSALRIGNAYKIDPTHLASFLRARLALALAAIQTRAMCKPLRMRRTWVFFE